MNVLFSAVSMLLFTTLVANVSSTASHAQATPQPIPLHDGQQVTLHGTLTLEPGGRLQFVTVRTRETYVPVVKAEDGKAEVNAEPTNEVSLSSYPGYRLMYAHRGQAVTVTGKMMTDDVTPYFFHATRLELASMKLDDGTELLHKTSRLQVPALLRSYRAVVVLPANLAAPWEYRADNRPDGAEQFLSCSSNGGGDVVNCFCANGFHAVRASSLTPGIAGQVFADMQMAQFDVGDDARRVELSVTCSR